jgi:hypothetical protein
MSSITISIGDLIYQENGRATSQRVLDVNGPVVENSYSAVGTLRNNISVTNIGTIKVFLDLAGQHMGKGKGKGKE